MKVKKSIGLVLLIVFVIYYFFFSLQRIKGEEKIAESVSPNGRYTVIVYLNNSGATTDYSALGVCIDNNTWRKKNIYWEYHAYEVVFYWENESIININGISLDVTKDTYDWRRNT